MVMEYIEKIAAVLSIATACAAAGGFVFRYYLKKFFEKVDRRQEKIEVMIKGGIGSLQNGFAELSRNQESSRKQMAREHRGLLKLFEKAAEHDRSEHGGILTKLTEINTRLESKGGA